MSGHGVSSSPRDRPHLLQHAMFIAIFSLNMLCHVFFVCFFCVSNSVSQTRCHVIQSILYAFCDIKECIC